MALNGVLLQSKGEFAAYMITLLKMGTCKCCNMNNHMM